MIALNVNGKRIEVDAEADTPLLWVLRDYLDMTGTKFGCGMALCGACTVHIDGQPTRSCVTPASAAALTGAITLKDGRVEQSNFHDYPVLRINQMPRVEVHIVASKEKPSGVGEPATPVIAPALANAILALGGKPVRALPLSAQGITFS